MNTGLRKVVFSKSRHCFIPVTELRTGGSTAARSGARQRADRWVGLRSVVSSFATSFLMVLGTVAASLPVTILPTAGAFASGRMSTGQLGPRLGTLQMTDKALGRDRVYFLDLTTAIRVVRPTIQKTSS